MSEGRLGLLVAILSLLVSGAAFVLPFYYQFLRERHDLGISILGYGYDTKTLSVSAAFVNRGTEDEVILDWLLTVAENPGSTYNFMSPRGDLNDISRLSNPYGASHFIVHHGEAVVKRLDWAIARERLPGLPNHDESTRRGKKTHVGLRIHFLGKTGQLAEKVFYFGAVTENDIPGMLSDGGTATGTIIGPINPKSVDLLKE
jgi:hypothetical protein